MVSFVWAAGTPMLAGTGGSETFTAGHARELIRRGIKTQIVTIGHGKQDGRQDFPDIPFLSLKSPEEISELPGKVVFVNKPYLVPTKQKSAVILHCVTPDMDEQPEYADRIRNKTIITTSIYSGQQWALYLNIPYSRIHIILPFADPIFGSVKRSVALKKRIVFAGRLHPDKGIYTLLETMHKLKTYKSTQTVTIVAAGLHVETGATIKRMLEDYPYAQLISAQKSIGAMAHVLSANDILLMPSVYAEPFGMLSVEAQHAGCRVVASNIGGLPETNCGLLTLVAPRNPDALVIGIKQALALGSATKKERETAKSYFTLKNSVDSLMQLLHL
jgi:D-inositol-3-phosphate glycosyltransferase